jgi:hypothetical protein
LAPLLARLWERFQAGDNQALFDLIVWSLAGGQAPPPEASTAFVERYDRWFKLEVRTLDEAFGVERHKGRQIDDLAAERERLRPYIVLRVEAWRKDKPAGRELFETIAKDFGKSRRYVEELYYEKESAAWRKAGEAGVFRRPKG